MSAVTSIATSVVKERRPVISLPARIYVLTTATVLAVLLAIGLALASEYRSEHRAAWQRNDAILFTIERYINSQFSTAASMLRGIADNAGDVDAGLNMGLPSLSRYVTEGMPALRTLLMLNDAGTVVFDSREGAPALGVDVSDRDYFAHHASAATAGLFVDRPVQSRIDGAWTLPISVASHDRDGDVDYVAVGSFSIAELNTVLSRAAIAPGTRIVVARDDGTVLTRWPDPEGLIGESIAESRLISQALPNALSGRFEATSPTTGVPMVVSYQAVTPFPIVVAVGQDADAVHQAVLARSLPWMIVAGLVVIAIITVGYRLGHQVLATERAKASAEAADRRKTEFLATMSHEMRTPLNAIIGFSELVRQDTLGDGVSHRYRGYLDHVGDSASLLKALVDDVLDLSAMLEGDVTLEQSDIPLEDLAQSAIAMVSGKAEERRITVTTTGFLVGNPEPQGWVLYGDRRRLLQLLVNLLSNAIKFSPVGGSVEVGLIRCEEALVCLYVRDWGPGIAQHNIQRVLQPFARLGDARVRSAEGVGLGLPIARQIARMHGADLEIDTTLGKGTRVTLTLPISRCRLEPIGSAGDGAWPAG